MVAFQLGTPSQNRNPSQTFALWQKSSSGIRSIVELQLGHSLHCGFELGPSFYEGI